MVTQNKETARNDDLGVFWKTVQYLISSNMLFHEGDYKIVYADKVIHTYKENGVWYKNEIALEETQNVL